MQYEERKRPLHSWEYLWVTLARVYTSELRMIFVVVVRLQMAVYYCRVSSGCFIWVSNKPGFGFIWVLDLGAGRLFWSFS
jgi:hypothetical protein